MPDTSPHDVTDLLVAWCDGDEEALDRLVPIVEAELRRLAHRYMGRERPGHLLQTTGLLNEAYLRLIDWKSVRWQNRAHFYGVAAGMMRRILVDYARKRPRGLEGEIPHVALDEGVGVPGGRDADLLALDDALCELGERDPQKARIVELRFFGGLGVEETAEALGIAPVTVKREWARAKLWLYRVLDRAEAR
jgi:RNA polymerase sigma-70 factor (ECF subfamily)